jgi:hypothetical protein
MQVAINYIHSLIEAVNQKKREEWNKNIILQKTGHT